jgi:hypothetical protein
MKKSENLAVKPVDNFVDKSAIFVDKSANPVDNLSTGKKLSTGKPTYPHFIHILIHRQNARNNLIFNNKKKLSTKNALPNNNNLYIFIKEVLL